MTPGKVLLEVKVQRDQCCHRRIHRVRRQGNLFRVHGRQHQPVRTSGLLQSTNGPAARLGTRRSRRATRTTSAARSFAFTPSWTAPTPSRKAPFLPGTPRTRPEIYTMGHRNPYRISVDPHTGAVYWGDVGPDANEDSVGRGPAGQDEVNRAPRPGNYGWPYFVGDNKAYSHVDFNTMQAGESFDPAHPVNRSPNNTGLTDLPPAQKALIWYPYGPSKEFPLVGAGGRTAMAGPVVHMEDFATAARPYPKWYDNKLITYDWMRGWFMAVTLDAAGNFASMERVMPSHRFANPIDMQFGPSGDLFVMEYGTTWFSGNDDARLLRMQYDAGNRAPVAVASVDKPAGALPLRVALSAAASTDADYDSLGYEWTVARVNGRVVRRLSGEKPSLTLASAGTYTATVTVTDPHGAKSTSSVLIAAGNEPPRVTVDLAGSNQMYYFPGVPVQYATRVTDREDGTLANGRIRPTRVRVTAEYMKEAPSTTTGSAGGALTPRAEGKAIIEGSDCLSCHKIDATSIGPAYVKVAERYRDDTTAAARLAKKVRAGGTGVWGIATMPAHPQLTEEQASRVVAYVLSLAEKSAGASAIPVSGRYTPADSLASSINGAVVLRASYTDRGAHGLLGVTAETTVVLRAPTLVVADGKRSDGVEKDHQADRPVDWAIAMRSGTSVNSEAVDPLPG
ncbi:MAG: PQQ-dependent sugar dehydrogenase [Gemmatimonadaceae bacterium]